MLTTNSKELYDKIMLLRTHGITKENMEENHGNWYYEMIALGFNYRLTDFQSALGITQLAKNNKGVARRNEIASTYEQPKEVVDYYYSQQQLLSSVEAVVLEDQVTELVLSKAKVFVNSLALNEKYKSINPRIDLITTSSLTLNTSISGFTYHGIWNGNYYFQSNNYPPVLFQLLPFHF